MRKTVLLAASPRHLNALGYYGRVEPDDRAHLLPEMLASYLSWVSTFATMLIDQCDAPKPSLELVECASKTDPVMARRMVHWVFPVTSATKYPSCANPRCWCSAPTTPPPRKR